MVECSFPNFHSSILDTMYSFFQELLTHPHPFLCIMNLKMHAFIT